MNLSQYKPFK